MNFDEMPTCYLTRLRDTQHWQLKVGPWFLDAHGLRLYRRGYGLTHMWPLP